MVFKKPYAFLIKYFKLINFIICVLSGYIAYRAYSIIDFFGDYILNNYSGNYYPGFSESYVNPFVYLVLIIILIGVAGIYLLFTYKKKPKKWYLVSMIYYIIFIIFLIFIKKTMITLEETVITAEIARFYRDISIIIFMPQIPLIIMFLLRGLGFNAKKFNFDVDLRDLEIEENDNEEIEIVLKKDNVKLRRNINRFLREFKYYVLENKFIVSIISIVLLCIIVIFIFMALPEIIDKNYKQGDAFSINNLKYKIEDSIVTNIDYKGNYIDDEKYYVVIKVRIENTSEEDIKLDYNNFRLALNDDYVYPIMDKGRNFVDYARDYYTEIIKAKSNNIYSIVYEIDENDLKKNYEIKIYNGTKLLDNLLMGSYNYISIGPAVINKVSNSGTFNQGEEINFVNSNLGNSTLKLSNAKILDKYIYDYEYCTKNSCNNYKDIVSIDYTTNKSTLIVMDYEYSMDDTIPFYNHSSDINTFVNSFIKVRYIENKKTAYAEIKNVTPKNLKGQIVVETTNAIKNSEEIEIAIVVRNKEYLVKIK